jgi:ATP-dependent DNA helicase RecQ
VLVGSFDRANLSYRVLPRREPLKQILEVLARHEGEAGIIYCIRRADVDETTAALRRHGVDARPYHAGLTNDERAATQEAFANEECDVVVATVAFGMGIDRSNIRFVLHTGLPKSIEHYQQETGRAGRDGREADCVLLYSAADVLLWRSIMERSAQEGNSSEEHKRIAMRHVDDIDRYARGAVCRHRALVQYFGETYEKPNCGACDLCLGDVQEVEDGTVIAQKILSCVARVDQRFGAGHVISILRGDANEKVTSRGHERLSTFGLLSDIPEAVLRDFVHQLIGHGLLAQEGDRYPILQLTERARPVLRGEESVRLVEIAKKAKRKKSRSEATEWEGVDEALFEALRAMRRDLAAERGVPPYVILGDRSLRDIARERPRSLAALRNIYGIGDTKLQQLGEHILSVVSRAV